MPATSQLDWLISMTAMIVLFWSRATRDLLRACPSEGWGRSAGASRHSIVRYSDEVAILAARPIASLGPRGIVDHFGDTNLPVSNMEQGGVAIGSSRWRHQPRHSPSPAHLASMRESVPLSSAGASGCRCRYCKRRWPASAPPKDRGTPDA